MVQKGLFVLVGMTVIAYGDFATVANPILMVEMSGFDRLLRRFETYSACILPARRPRTYGRSTRLRLSEAKMHNQCILNAINT